MAASFFSLPHEMASLRQYCVRVGKRPFIRKKPPKRGFSAKWQDTENNERLTLTEALKAAQEPVKVWDDGRDKPVEGIGFLVERSTHDVKKPLGGDLDCCRDPMTGAVSPWAEAFLQAIQPFHTEVSLSKCGIRFFTWGHLPEYTDSIFGHGPQDDQSAQTRERILAAKPNARAKWERSELVFNGLELYEDKRHLTLTGDVLEGFCYPQKDRTEAIKQALESFMVADRLSQMEENLKKSSGTRLPKLDILKVIDTKGFIESGGQLFGSHPTEGSSSGRNLVIDPTRGVWAYMHNKPAKGDPGGDAWTWLAREVA